MGVVDGRTCSMKKRLDHANEIMERWTSKPLLERDKKPVELIELDPRVFKKAKSERRHQGGRQGGGAHAQGHEQDAACRTSLDWHYIDFINNIVVDGLAGVITVSLEFS